MGCVGGTCPVGPARPRALSRRARHRVAHDWAGPGRAVAVAGTAGAGTQRTGGPLSPTAAIIHCGVAYRGLENSSADVATCGFRENDRPSDRSLAPWANVLSCGARAVEGSSTTLLLP